MNTPFPARFSLPNLQIRLFLRNTGEWLGIKKSLSESTFTTVVPRFFRRVSQAISRLLLCALVLAPVHLFGAERFDYKLLHSFGIRNDSGYEPRSALIVGSDGRLYGTTKRSALGSGSVYSIKQNGEDYRVLHHFAAPRGGSTPAGGLIEHSNGDLYGTVLAGGRSNLGGIFRLDKSGNNYQLIVEFTGSNGASPEMGLVEQPGGFIFGTTLAGGSKNAGVFFRISDDGSFYQLIHDFDPDGDASYPSGLLAIAPDGRVYGTTESGKGNNHLGAIFRYAVVKRQFEIAYQFSLDAKEGWAPSQGLVVSADTNGLIGMTLRGGDLDQGTLYRIPLATQDTEILKLTDLKSQTASPCVFVAPSSIVYSSCCGGDFNSGELLSFSFDTSNAKSLYSFPKSSAFNLAVPSGLAFQGGDSVFGITAYNGFSDEGTLYKFNMSDGKWMALHEFSSTRIPGEDGAMPDGGVIEDSHGILYGTTYHGGLKGRGSVFAYDKRSSTSSILHSFEQDSQDGYHPYGGLILANGSVVGTTTQGGLFDRGTLFSIDLESKKYSLLVSFDGTNGSSPQGDLASVDGVKVFGITRNGGNNGAGTVFAVEPSGQLTTLHHFQLSFSAENEGFFPWSGISVAANGKLYGTTSEGGSHAHGTVFQIEVDGGNYRVLHSFSQSDGDGGSPRASLLAAPNGKIFGVTWAGGNGSGAIYSIEAENGSYRRIRAFSSDASEGTGAYGGLSLMNDGTLIGTTWAGGKFGMGTLYSIQQDGSDFKILHHFGETPEDAAQPASRLFLSADQAFYGTSTLGGNAGLGTIYRIGTPVLQIVLAIRFDDTKLTILFPTNAGETYDLQSSTDLVQWSSVELIHATTQESQIEIPLNSESRKSFYRIVAQ